MKTIKIAATLVLALGACTTEVGDIDRTQPNYVEKKLFTGEWYYMQTITDVGYTQAWARPGETGPLEKIRWDIQEGMLVAYRTWEYIPGAEEKNDAAVRSPVAAFAIQKHFDRRRGYNTVTGQQNNTIGENDYDRPWYERDFMRVDWSKNLIDDLGFFVYMQNMSPASYYVQEYEEQDPNRPSITADYIDLTSRYLATPDWESCYYILEEYPDWCGASTITVRSSFKKIDPAKDYEPWNYMDNLPIPVDTDNDGKDDNFLRWSYNDEPCDSENDLEDCYEIRVPVFERFGYFRTEKLTYDKQRGITLSGRQNLINRFNIWQDSLDANGNPIPYSQRTPKPVVFYLNVDFPKDIGETAAQDIGNDWNRAMLDTVRGLGVPAAAIPPRMVEVRRNDCNLENVRAFVGRHKELNAKLQFIGGVDALASGNLDRACAVLEYNTGEGTPVKEKFTWQRLGDLRYNQMVWQDKPNVSPFYSGLAQLNPDPETGEIVQANAIVAGYMINEAASRWLDYLDLINNKISKDDVAAGEYITKRLYGRRMEREARNRRAFGPATLNKLGQRLEALGKDRYVEIPPDVGDQRLKMVKGSDLERKFLLTDEIKQAFAGPRYQPGMPLAPEMAERASPASWGTSEAFRKAQERKSLLGEGLAFRSRDRKEGDVIHPGRPVTAVFEPNSMVDDAIAGLALKWKDLPREEAMKRIAIETYRAIGGHEVGHVFGLRHNFQASFDALNWDDEFWHVDAMPQSIDAALAKTDDELAMKDLAGNVEKAGSLYRAELQLCKTNLAAMAEPFQLTTQDCLENQERMYASIMDYHRKMNSDWAGIGKYDRAAIKFGYGKLVEVFDESPNDKFVPRDSSLGRYLGPFGIFDYRDAGKILSGIPSYTDGVVTYEDDYGKELDTQYQAYLAAPDKRQNIRKRKLITLDQVMAQRRAAYSSATEVERRTSGDVEVPYEFCPDRFADWRFHCQRSDLGGNMREIVNNIVDDYHLYYPFRNFKRDRYGWGGVSGYLGGMYNGTFFPLMQAFRYFSYYTGYYTWRPWAQYPQSTDWSTATNVGLNFIGEVLQTPEPGKYCKQGAEFVLSPDGQCTGGAAEFDVPFVVGKFYDNSFTEDYNYKMARIGVIYDKIAAIWALTDSDAFFYRSTDGFTNRRAWSIGYYRLFKEEMLKLFESMITGQGRGVSGRVVQDKDSSGNPIAGTEHFMPNLLIEEPSSVDYAEVAALSPKGSFSWTLRWYGLLYGMAKMTSMIDGKLDFDKYIKVALDGSPEDVNYGAVDELAWNGEGDAAQCTVTSYCSAFDVRDVAAMGAVEAKGLDAANINPPAGPVVHDVYLAVQKYGQDAQGRRTTLPVEKYLITTMSGTTVNLRTSFATGENTGDYLTTPLVEDVDLEYSIHVVKGSERVSFTDPLSRYSYTAVRMDNDLGIAAHLVDKANALVVDYQTKKVTYDNTPKDPATAKTEAFRAFQDARTKLAEQQELIDQVRQFHTYFEYAGGATGR